MRYQRSLAIGLFATFLLGACRKDAENELPTVRFLHPGEGSTLSVPDTTDITVHVEDDHSVERVSVTLVNSSGIPVAPGVEVYVGSSATDVDLRLPLANEQLESGDYRLLAAVNDGEHTVYAYLPVHVNGAPLRLRSIFIVSNAGSSVVLERIDSIGQLSMVNTWAMDLGGAAVDAASATVFVAGGISGALIALAPDGQSVRWQQPNLGTLGLPYFTSLDVGADGRLYVGRSDGYLRGFLPVNGSGLFTAPLDGVRSRLVCVMNDLVVSATRSISSPDRFLTFHHRSSGAVADQQPLNKDAIALFRRSASEVLIFGNSGGQGILESRDINTGSSWEPRTWPSTISCVEQVDDNTWLVALADGSIERFTSNNSSSINIANGPPLVDMTFDPTNGGIIAAHENGIIAIDPNSGNTMSQWSTSPGVRRVLALFNR